jgi:hypothetical protein
MDLVLDHDDTAVVRFVDDQRICGVESDAADISLELIHQVGAPADHTCGVSRATDAMAQPGLGSTRGRCRHNFIFERSAASAIASGAPRVPLSLHPGYAADTFGKWVTS